jgi:hypothetical protein
VLSDRGRLTTGTPVYQPSLLDIETSDEEVARLGRFSLWTSHDGTTIDAGLAEPHASVSFTPEVLSLGALAAPRSAHPRMPVCKVGRTSGLTHGKVRHTSASLKILTHPNGKQQKFTNQTIIEGINRAVFGDSGDSGALILDSETKLAIASLVGGGFEEHHSHFTVATPLEAVLDVLRISLSYAIPSVFSLTPVCRSFTVTSTEMLSWGNSCGQRKPRWRVSLPNRGFFFAVA